jgi:hypothetical protein
VSGWATIFLGVIAAASLATAFVQIAVIVVAGRLARRMMERVDRLEREMTPIVGHLNAMARDAARAASLATAQVERIDRLFEDAVKRLEDALRDVQSVIAGPIRQGAALVAGFRAVLGLARDLRVNRSRRRADEEDTLFI